MRRNKRINSNTKHWKRITGIILKYIVYAAILFFVFTGGYRFIQMMQYWHKNSLIKEKYVIQVERLKQEQEALKKRIDDLNNNPVVLEKLARDIGFVKPGEVIYRLPNKGEK
ncbi:hypothetical protein GF312_14580 [Candidatus Poribacteria bacterium]|nr:hypothetical protein [Candidatus Poribacteria bacterium]